MNQLKCLSPSRLAMYFAAGQILSLMQKPLDCAAGAQI